MVLRELCIFPLWGVDLGHFVGGFGELGNLTLWGVDLGHSVGGFGIVRQFSFMGS